MQTANPTKKPINDYVQVIVREPKAPPASIGAMADKLNVSKMVVLTHILNNVLTFEEMAKYVNAFNKLPHKKACAEIYLLGGFDNWYKPRGNE